MLKIYSIALALLFFTSSCSVFFNNQQEAEVTVQEPLPLPPILDGSFFGEKIDIISVAEIFALTREQQANFLHFYNDRKITSISPHKRIYRFMERRLESFEYFADTVIATESLSLNKGNCLSLAILTKSLADLANIEISYQLVETEPIYQKEGNIIVSSQHIQTVLFQPKSLEPGNFFIFPDRIVIDYFPVDKSRILRRVDEDEFISMFYSNRAAEALLQDDNNLAYWYIKSALDTKPNDANAINIMAVIHERSGYSDYAEKLYLFGLENVNRLENQNQQQLDLLNNYHTLLKWQDRIEEAEKIAERIALHEDPNPFKWISLGNHAYNDRDYSKAISYYKKASKMAPYLHETYAGIARAQFQMGNLESTERSLKKALSNSHKDNIRDMYQIKIDALKKMVEHKKSH